MGLEYTPKKNDTILRTATLFIFHNDLESLNRFVTTFNFDQGRGWLTTARAEVTHLSGCVASPSIITSPQAALGSGDLQISRHFCPPNTTVHVILAYILIQPYQTLYFFFKSYQLRLFLNLIVLMVAYFVSPKLPNLTFLLDVGRAYY